MNEALVVGSQVLVIFIYVLIGFVAVKKGVIRDEAAGSFTNLALTIILPCVIVNYYLREMEPEHLKGLGLAFLLAVIAHVIAILAATVLVPKREDRRYRVERISAVYSNCGFMGLPLIQAVVGEIGVFYAVAYLSVFNVLMWSHGVIALVGKERMTWYKTIVNPGFLAFLAGLALYFFQIPLPGILRDAIGGMSSLNTPVSMITTGIFLAGVNIPETLRDGRIYYISGLRLLVMPLLMMAVIGVLGVAGWIPGADKVVMANLLACACPTAATATLFPARFGLGGGHGAKIMGMTTLLSVLTIPLISLLTNLWILG